MLILLGDQEDLRFGGRVIGTFKSGGSKNISLMLSSDRRRIGVSLGSTGLLTVETEIGCSRKQNNSNPVVICPG